MESNIKLFEACYGITYIRHINGLYLAMKHRKLVLSSERFLWRVEIYENNRFFLKDIDDHDIAEYYGGNLQIALDSGYSCQHWNLYLNQNGNVLIEHSDTNNYFLYSDNNELTIKERTNDLDGFNFIFENSSLTQGYPYIEIKSMTNKISLRLEPTILKIANKSWLEEWANDLEKAVYSLSRLVGNMPFSTFEIRAYANCNSWGYVFYGKHIVHINNLDMKNEIIRMRKRKCRDISFGVLHELSHLFDDGRWLFDGEAMANLKIAYVLQELDFTVCLSDHSNHEIFTSKNYVEELYREHGRLDNLKGLFCSSLAAKLAEIASTIGWDAYKKVFRNFPQISNESSMKRFETFIQKLSDYSNQDVRNMFNTLEWFEITKNIKQ